MSQRKKILLIEDEKTLGEILFNKLNEQGYETKWELDGVAGFAAVRSFRPDLILLDIVMPKKDGYEVLEDISKDEQMKKIPVIIISNSGQPVEIERILALGAKDYIVKAQFSPEEVLSKMHKYLSVDQTPETAVPSSSARKKIHILVIEDDSYLSSLATRRLASEGYNVTAAFDGEQGMSGLDVLKKVRAEERYRDVVVIIFSNLGQEQEIAEARELGADDFLVKANFTLREVLEKIETMLKKRGKL